MVKVGCQKKIQAILLALAVSVSVFSTPVYAQSYRPVAMVNDVPITGYDLDQRLRLMSVLLGVTPTAQQKTEMASEILQALIDEKLQKEAAVQGEIKLLDDQKKLFRDRIVKQVGMSEEQFKRNLAQKGVDVEAFDAFVESQARWNALIVSQFASKITISDNEIMEIAQRIAGSAQMKAHLSEIFVPIDSAVDEQKAQKKMMTAVEALKAGENFGVLASRLSESPSRSNKGDLGWVSLGQIDPALASEITNRTAGSVVGPMRSERGIHLLYVHEKKQDEASGSGVSKAEDGTFSIAPEMRQKIEEQLFQQELALQARRYLQSLRQNAVLKLNQ